MKKETYEIQDVEQEDIRISAMDKKISLTDEQVCEIRRLFYLKGVTNGAHIARVYGISKRACWDIIKGKTRTRRMDKLIDFDA